jgi:D-sedoheptulose 7-phosphate isomerase
MGVQAYFAELADVLARLDAAAVDRLIDAVRRARDAGGMIYTLGNGGSASTASHLALDLAKNTRRADRPNMRVFALTDNVGLLTAWANDAHYEEVFAAQLDAVVRRDDLVVAISASGNSRNVLAAVAVARAAGARTFGLTGYDGGALRGAADDCVVVPSRNMQAIEDAHLAIVHGVMCALRDDG